MRIACGVAQGLALGADLPVVPVPTLEALAQEARRAHGWTRVVACLDARMREVYVAAYARDGGRAGATVVAPVGDWRPPTLRLPAARRRRLAAPATASPRIPRSRARARPRASSTPTLRPTRAVDRRARAAAARRGRGRRRGDGAAALRAAPRRADDRRARRRRAPLTHARRWRPLPRYFPRPVPEWRPLRDGDVAYVAALEAQIHAAPWTAGNFRDALAAGYSARVGEREGRIVAYGVLMLAPGEAQILNLSVVPDARRAGPRPRAAAPLRRRCAPARRRAGLPRSARVERSGDRAVRARGLRARRTPRRLLSRAADGAIARGRARHAARRSSMPARRDTMTRLGIRSRRGVPRDDDPRRAGACAGLAARAR